MTTKAKSTNPFAGRWRIVSMEQWDRDFVDDEEEGYFEFTDKDRGEFHFGYVHFLEPRADLNHENHCDMKEWCGGKIDPEDLDSKKVTKETKKLK